MQFFYISFAVTGKKHGHLGSTVVEAEDAQSAHAVATKLGLNPGGEAMIVPVPADANTTELRWLHNKLRSKAELAARGPISRGRQRGASYVCELCNTGVPHEH